MGRVFTLDQHDAAIELDDDIHGGEGIAVLFDR
jgi:hypothetical protein